MAKRKAKVLTQLESEREVNNALFLLGEEQRYQKEMELELEGKIARLKAEYAPKALATTQTQKDLFTQIMDYCAIHREELLSGAVKYHQFPNGKVEWSFPGWSVTVKKGQKLEDVIQELTLAKLALIERGLPTFIRTKEEVDKEQLLSHRQLLLESTLKFSTFGFSNVEDFVVTPSDETKSTS